jgi:hypothetical protein
LLFESVGISFVERDVLRVIDFEVRGDLRFLFLEIFEELVEFLSRVLGSESVDSKKLEVRLVAPIAHGMLADGSDDAHLCEPLESVPGSVRYMIPGFVDTPDELDRLGLHVKRI